MKPIHTLILICTITALLSGCTAQGTEPAAPTTLPSAPPETVAPTTEPPISPAEQLLSAMSLREKVGQLFIIRPDALDLTLDPADIDNSSADGITALSEEMYEALKTYPVGGFILFSKNITGPQQLVELNTQLQEALPITPFLATDEEGGVVARLANHPAFSLPKYKSAGAVGAKSGQEGAHEMGMTIGGYLRDYGFNMDFAPVADVNTNPRNPVIGTRAFSSDPSQAADFARAMADGLLQNDIIPVFKHFPGHGDTAEDSHRGIAVNQKTEAELESCEWLPFLQAEDRECIMVGHIALPAVTGDLTPATLSPALVTDLLRGRLGFQGLIVTDSLAMGAITQDYTPAEAALGALNAGCDLLLMPQNLGEAFEGVLSAVEDGSFPEAQLDQVVLRILNFKLDHHILVY